jgi:hypothetical protein
MLVRSKKDRVPVEIDGVTFFFAPLTVAEKTELMGAIGKEQGPAEMMSFAYGVVSKTLKNVTGLQTESGSNYQLQFNGDTLASECIDDLMNLPLSEKVCLIAGQFLKGVPSEGQILDPRTGNILDGIIVKKSVPVP